MSAKNEFGNRANVVHLNGIRIAPRKLRLLIDLIRNKPVSEALSELVVKTAFVDSGVTLKRFAPRAQGRASSIMKRSSRVTIELRPE